MKLKIKENTTGIILAGGRNERMGRHKAFLKFGDMTLIELILNIHSKFCSQIIIVTDNKSLFNEVQNVNIIEDEIPYRGPLSGIYYGLKASNNQINFITSCDTPFIKEKVVQYLLNIANENDYDAVIPYIKSKFQPLLSIYSRSCLKWIKKSLNTNHFRITDIFNNINIKKIYENELILFDPELVSFININTQEEYINALKD